MNRVAIYHNPDCSTSRNTLALIRNTGIEPQVIEYLVNPPSRELLKTLIGLAEISVRDAIRIKEPQYKALGLDDLSLSDEQLLDAMLAHPILINRPFVVSEMGVELCRPSELVLDILPLPQLKAFSKEDGEMVIDVEGNRVI